MEKTPKHICVELNNSVVTECAANAQLLCRPHTKKMLLQREQGLSHIGELNPACG